MYRLCFFFFNDTATTEIYTLSLHDALPICRRAVAAGAAVRTPSPQSGTCARGLVGARGLFRFTSDRKSTRLNSSHANISYAVFCLKKKKIKFSNVLSLYIDLVLSFILSLSF